MPLGRPTPSRKDNGQRDSTPQRPGRSTPGPSSLSSKQGYCSYCQVYYTSLEQHLITARHRERVRSKARASVSTGSIMERFLQDVLTHHPYHYSDTRPTHEELPYIDTLPTPHVELSTVDPGSKGDRASVGTRDEMPSTDDEEPTPAPVQHRAPPSAQKKDVPAPAATKLPLTDTAVEMPTTSTQSGSNAQLNPPLSSNDSPTQGFMHRTSSTALHTPSNLKCYSRKVCTTSGGTQTPTPAADPAHSKAPTPAVTPALTPAPTIEQPANSQSQHRKALKKTNRHVDENQSPSNSLAGAEMGTVPTSNGQAAAATTTIADTNKPKCEKLLLWTPALLPGQIDAREQKKPDVETDDDEEGSFHLSLHSMNNSEMSKGWDETLQVATADAAAKAEEKNLTGLMETCISLEDQGYCTQLDSALKAMEETGEMFGTEEEEQALPNVPNSQPALTAGVWDDHWDEKFYNMIREFREGRFRNYLSTESLACYGKHSQKKRPDGMATQFDDVAPGNVAVNNSDYDDDGGDALPLMDHAEDDAVEDQPTLWHELPPQPAVKPVVQPQKRNYRLAARCEVVKVSHGTQTTHVSCPVVRKVSMPLLELQQCQEEELRQQQEEEEEEEEGEKQKEQEKAQQNDTPNLKASNGLSLPSFYSKVMVPIQPRTIMYVLSSPAETLATITKQPGKRRPGGGRKKKPCNLDNPNTYKYKKNTFKYYDPLTNQIVKNPPKVASSNSKTKHARKLFRSLSPDNNKDRCSGSDVGNGECWGSPRRGTSGAWPDSGVAELCASGTASGLDGAGPSEPGSSLTSSRRALVSRSSICSTSRFLLGTIPSGPSITDSTAVRPSSQSQSQTNDSQASEESSGSEQAGGGVGGRKKRKKERKARSSTSTLRSPPSDDSEYLPYSRRKRRKKTPTSKKTSPQQRKGRPRKEAQAGRQDTSTEGRTSPCGDQGGTQTSPESAPRIQSPLRP